MREHFALRATSLHALGMCVAATDGALVRDAMAAIDAAERCEVLDPADKIHPGLVLLSRAGGKHASTEAVGNWLLALGCCYSATLVDGARPH